MKYMARWDVVYWSHLGREKNRTNSSCQPLTDISKVPYLSIYKEMEKTIIYVVDRIRKVVFWF